MSSRAFPPLCGDKPRTLILGTFPSTLSRECGEYYGNPRNQFWRLLFGVFSAPFDRSDYERKKAVLFANGVAIWDVIAECEPEGALDSGIRNPVYNTELPEFVAERGIERVLFNGNNAYVFYRRGIGAIERNVLPSSSPANARLSFEAKLGLWREIMET
ncbi:MAG: DNA-deoxyinosine glycosylase [Oscillospiraceae bacterium]|nr:DNA-deoxyinosine glycosylase [Oscillospiraceae bacterium]